MLLIKINSLNERLKCYVWTHNYDTVRFKDIVKSIQKKKNNPQTAVESYFFIRSITCMNLFSIPVFSIHLNDLIKNNIRTIYLFESIELELDMKFCMEHSCLKLYPISL